MFLEIIIFCCVIVIIVLIARKLPNVVKFNISESKEWFLTKFFKKNDKKSQGNLNNSGDLAKDADKFFDNKDYQEAEKAYLQLAIKEPKNIKVYNRLGAIYTELKNFSDAKEAFSQALKLNSENASGYFNFALAEIELKDYRNAVEALEKAVKLDKNNKKYQKLLEETQKRIKNKPEEPEE